MGADEYILKFFSNLSVYLPACLICLLQKWTIFSVQKTDVYNLSIAYSLSHFKGEANNLGAGSTCSLNIKVKSNKNTEKSPIESQKTKQNCKML